MFWFSYFWSSLTELASRVDQLIGIDQFSTSITLITLRIRMLTLGTSAIYKSISKKSLTSNTELLANNLFICITCLLKSKKDTLGNLCMLLRWCSAKQISITIKPFVNPFMNSMILITNLSWCHSFLDSLGLSCSSIFICTTNVYCIVPHEPCESGIDVSREYTSNDISKMRDVVNVWESTCYQDVSFASLRKNFLSFG